MRSGRELWMGLGVILFMGLFAHERKVYDMATAMFFALCLGAMARGRWGGYMLAFGLGTLNRETMILMAIVFAVYGFWILERRVWIGLLGYQVYVYGILQAGVRVIFADMPGAAMWFRPIENFWIMKEHPWEAAIHWAAFGAVTWVCARRWKHAHPALRAGLGVLVPSLMGLYVLCGWFLEVRVFAEIFPVVWLLTVSGLSAFDFPPNGRKSTVNLGGSDS